MRIRHLLLSALMGLFATGAYAQSTIPREYRGNEAYIARGVLDGNLIETNFRNHAELSRWNDFPWGIWPRGIGGRHIDGIGMLIGGLVPGEREKWQQFYPGKKDTVLNPVIINYRDFGKRLGPDGRLWGWLPLPGFHNPNRVDPVTGQLSPTPALSDDPTSWPNCWPDRLYLTDDPGWCGKWNGLFGKGVMNADLESYYVIDDHSDMEYAIDPRTGRPYSPYGVFYPDPTDSTMGGLGLQVQVRILQWANVLAEDAMFILYRITNVGKTEHESLYFNQIMDFGLGWEEGDENAAYNPQQDVAYGWDQDGIGTNATGGKYKLGYTGFAFLESPAREWDGLDNDEDGFVDESRFNGPGMLIEGRENIEAYVQSQYNLANFEAFYGPLHQRPAYLVGRWWTGDENLDWVGFSDDNGNGRWDPGELVNNDVGRDGLGPYDLGYPGPDEGEADGMPTPGEPNFGELDVDESDQIGLTGFDLSTRPFYESGNNLRDDTWLWQRIMLAQFPLGTPPAQFVADVEPFILFSSGPVRLHPDRTDFFSTAWLFGEDEQDFFKNRRVVQSIYNADYNFAQAPYMPTLTAVPGDGQVVLTWDTLALASFDRFSQEFDFEGFRLYKGTDPLLSDARVVTNVHGVPMFYKPIAQWDLKNGIRGPVPVLEGEAVYNLGDDTGLSFYYIDKDVTNGITYYYALVAYDRGYIDTTGVQSQSIDPQENTFKIGVDQAGNITIVSRNAAVVVPRARPAGYLPGTVNEDLSRPTVGIGTGSLDVKVLVEEDIRTDAIYRMNFFSEPKEGNPDEYITVAYEVEELTEQKTVIPRRALESTTPLVDGFLVEIRNDEEEGYVWDETGYRAEVGPEQVLYSLDPRELEGYTTNWIASVRPDTTPSFVAADYDYELRWVNPEDSLYRPPRFGIGTYLRREIPIFAVNLTKNTLADLLIVDRNESGAFDAGDELIINEKEIGKPRKFRHRVRFRAADPNNSVPPKPGDRLRITVHKQFHTGDYFQFTLRESQIDTELARSELDRIAVVPNPYFAAAEWERRSQLVGRGERRIQFIHLPQQCTIRIYTLRGELIKTIQHEGIGSDGAEWWDLKTEDNLEIAYGVYIYHVEAPGIGEHVGKFAIVK